MNQILRTIGSWLCARGWHQWRPDPQPPIETFEGLSWLLDGKRTATCRRCGGHGVKYGFPR